MFFRGIFYCLGTEGKLGVFNPVENKWTVLAKPKQFGIYYRESYLVESEDELLSVLISKHGTNIHDFRLNQVHIVWKNIESLESRTLFDGSPMSLSTTPPVGRMKNRCMFQSFMAQVVSSKETSAIQQIRFDSPSFQHFSTPYVLG